MSVSTASGVSATHVEPNIFRGDTAPTGAVEGTLWVDTSANPNTLNVADSSGVFSPISGGGGSPSTPLKPYDEWLEAWFHSGTSPNHPFLGAAIGSGVITNGAGILGTADGFWQDGIWIQSSATANSGFRWYTGAGFIRFSGKAYKYRAAYRHSAQATVTTRSGFHTATNITAPTYGAWVEFVGNTVVGKTASASVSSTTASSYTVTTDAIYIHEVEVDAAASVVTFRILDAYTEAVLWQDTLTTNIPPATSAGMLRASFIGTNSGTVQTSIGLLYMMGLGTPDGFTRARG